MCWGGCAEQVGEIEGWRAGALASVFRPLVTAHHKQQTKTKTLPSAAVLRARSLRFSSAPLGRERQSGARDLWVGQGLSEADKK